MRWLSFALLLFIHSTRGIFAELRTSKILSLGLNDPRRYGEVHNLVFERLREKYEKSGLPSNKEVVISDTVDILEYTVCVRWDNSCRNQVASAMAVAVRQREHKSSHHYDFNYPKNMESSLRDVFDRALDTLLGLDKDNREEVQTTLKELQKEAECVENVHPYYKFLTVAAMDVALKSTEMWHEMRYGEDTLLRSVQHLGNDRSLQQVPGFPSLNDCTSVIVFADVVSFLSVYPTGFVLTVFYFIPIIIPIFLPTIVFTTYVWIFFLVNAFSAFVMASVTASAVAWLFSDDICAD